MVGTFSFHDNTYALREGARVGCFPDLHEALGEVGVDQVITL